MSFISAIANNNMRHYEWHGKKRESVVVIKMTKHIDECSPEAGIQTHAEKHIFRHKKRTDGHIHMVSGENSLDGFPECIKETCCFNIR